MTKRIATKKIERKRREHFVEDRSVPYGVHSKHRHNDLLELVDLQEFWRHTKLTGFTQIGTRKGLRWKLFWIIVAVAGFIMSLYQSRHVINDYFSDRTIQIIGFENVMKVPFPSLTVCSNVRLHNSKWTPQIGRSVCNSRKRKDCYRTASSDKTGVAAQKEHESRSVDALLQLQLNYTPSERYAYFHADPMEDPFIKACFWKGFECNTSDEETVIFFNSLLHGLCLTINPGFNETMLGADYREFELVLDMDFLSRKLIFNDLFATFWVHKPGSSPALYSDSTGRVYPGDKGRVSFVVKNITRNKVKNCRYLHDFESRKLNVFYTDDTPYLYQQASCIIYKENQVAMKKGCLHFSLPFPDFDDGFNASKYTYCTTVACWNNCTDLNEITNEEIREGCPVPCWDISIHYNIKITSLLLQVIGNTDKPEMTVMHSKREDKMAASILPQLREVSRIFSDKWQDRILKFWRNMSNETIVKSSMMLFPNGSASNIKTLGQRMRGEFVSILQTALMNNVIEEIQEESKYSVSGFLGILGGNVGLWVGVSIISIAELIELTYLVIRLVIRRYSDNMNRVNVMPPPPSPQNDHVT